MRVADFGLSRTPTSAEVATTHETIPGEAASGDSTSAITSDLGLGTLAYMPPEQRAGAGDEAADQYALCASLFEALAGELPPREHADVAALRLRGMPRWLRAAIARGLAANPRARWPSVAVLVERLEGGLAGTRRRALAALGVVTLAGSVAATAVLWPREPACDDAGARMQPIWSPARAEAIGAAFGERAGARGERAWSATVGPIDAWTTEWIAARDASCAATRVEHTQSEAVLERSMRCFDNRAAQLAALLDRFDALAADQIHNASDAVTRLPAVAACRSEPYLLATVAPPQDAATLAGVERAAGRAARGRGDPPHRREPGGAGRRTSPAGRGRGAGLRPGAGRGADRDRQARHRPWRDERRP